MENGTKSKSWVELAASLKQEGKKVQWFKTNYLHLTSLEGSVARTVLVVTVKDWDKSARSSRERYQVEARLYIFVPGAIPVEQSSVILYNQYAETKKMAELVAANLYLEY